MNSVTALTDEKTNNNKNFLQKFVGKFLEKVAPAAPFVLPIFLAAEPTTKWGWWFVTVMSTILGLASIVNLILSFVLKNDNKYKKILKKIFWPTVANVGAFLIYLILHVIDAFTNFKIMERLFAKWMEGGTVASILNFFIGLLRVPFGLLYFTSGGFIGRAVYNKKTFGAFVGSPENVTGLV
jgi:hypothetical protein